ncbi:hypothetical protein K440DRAFT_555982 [Wilcoxina mikolae CBS 423.85]|nr:hypothetical protein K440DRAFT_555982 [Wilcoxina mikolae CBS 423.85]
MAPSKKSAKANKTEVATEPPAAADVPPSSPKDAKKTRRGSQSAGDVLKTEEPILKPQELKAFLGEDKDLVISKEVAKLNWKMNTSPASLDESKAMKETPISNPKVRKLNIFFSTGIHVTARAPSTSKHGVTVHDVLMAIHKLYKKKADDELELPVLANIEWGRGADLQAASDEWPAVVLATQKKEQAVTGKKKKQ